MLFPGVLYTYRYAWLIVFVGKSLKNIFYHIHLDHLHFFRLTIVDSVSLYGMGKIIFL